MWHLVSPYPGASSHLGPVGNNHEWTKPTWPIYDQAFLTYIYIIILFTKDEPPSRRVILRYTSTIFDPYGHDLRVRA